MAEDRQSQMQNQNPDSCTHECSSCGSNCSSRGAAPGSFQVKPLPGTHIKKIIGVVSGKGGVGKSFVTGLCGCAVQKAGFQTAILDADITGPSIPKMFGAVPSNQVTKEGYMIPAVSASGIKLMSLNLLLEDETQPVVWRGPVIAGVVKQFYQEVVWNAVDVLFVDMPPGTGDVPLTVFQSLPVDGIIIVTTPQDLVSMIVEKAVRMADEMKIPILGVMENMSYMKCPHCGELLYPFGQSHIESYTAKNGVALLGRLPMNPEWARYCDEGRIEEIETGELESLMGILKGQLNEV